MDTEDDPVVAFGVNVGTSRALSPQGGSVVPVTRSRRGPPSEPVTESLPASVDGGSTTRRRGAARRQRPDDHDDDFLRQEMGHDGIQLLLRVGRARLTLPGDVVEFCILYSEAVRAFLAGQFQECVKLLGKLPSPQRRQAAAATASSLMSASKSTSTRISYVTSSSSPMVPNAAVQENLIIEAMLQGKALQDLVTVAKKYVSSPPENFTGVMTVTAK